MLNDRITSLRLVACHLSLVNLRNPSKPANQPAAGSYPMRFGLCPALLYGVQVSSVGSKSYAKVPSIVIGPQFWKL